MKPDEVLTKQQPCQVPLGSRDPSRPCDPSPWNKIEHMRVFVGHDLTWILVFQLRICSAKKDFHTT